MAISEIEYDADGNVVLHENDYNGDGTAESAQRYEYDANGYCTLQERDNDGDGVFEYAVREEYDDAGRRIYFSIDLNGEPVNPCSITYDDNGSVLQESCNDGVKYYENTYDADGRLLHTVVYQGDESNVLRTIDYEYTFFDSGNIESLVTTLVYAAGTKVREERYNEDGVTVEITERDSDNAFPETGTGSQQYFDDDGRIVFQGSITTDGLVDYRESHSWIRDEHGNILIQNDYTYFNFDMDLDEWIPDVSGFYYYDCYKKHDSIFTLAQPRECLISSL